MRILAVNWRDMEHPEAGGAELHLHEILLRLAQWGHEVTLLSSAWPGADPACESGPYRVLRAGKWWNANWVLAAKARALCRRESFDVIIEDVNKIPFLLPWLTRLPHLLVIPHLFGRTVFRETNPLLATYVYLHEFLIPLVYRRSKVLAISPSTRDDLVSRGFRPDQVFVSYCGFTPRDYVLGEAEAKPTSPPRLIHTGRLRRYKGVDIVLRSFALILRRLPDAQLDIVGDGPERPALEKLSRKLGLQGSVHFHGHLPLSEMARRLWEAHLFLNSSPKEGWGLTVIETAACGIPAVAADSPGLRDSVSDGETGILVPYGDQEAMAQAAIDLLGDRERLEEMGRKAASRAVTFTWDRTARETEQALVQLVGEGK